MYGTQMGTLNVYARTGNAIGSPILSTKGNHGNKWLKAQVSVRSTSTWQLTFEGIRGTGVRSDIAIDDVTITNGACIGDDGSCNFEKDTCSWRNTQIGDDFDWLRKQGHTGSSGTGPSKDHTIGNFLGHYMYIETSAPRVAGNKAWLVSQQFNPSKTTQCISFWYHMYGTTIGSLNVYLNASGSMTQLWTQTGNKGINWLQGQFPLQPVNSLYMIYFEGVRGSSYSGDIGLDDFTFSQSSCGYQPSNGKPGKISTTPQSSTVLPTFQSNSKYDCSFETGSLCTWTQDTTDNFNWTLSQGPTGTMLTGPIADHTTGTDKGWYIYVETSSPRKPNDKARLLSAQVPSRNAYCLKFWYHMYGPHVNALNIYKKTSSLGSPIWTKLGTQGNQWKSGQVNIPASTTNYNVAIEGVVGPGYRGDIGIDDIHMVPGACPNQGGVACSFDTDLCGWAQSKSDDFDWTQRAGSTSSSGTGPTNDHTTNTRSGSYIYIESSSPRRPGQKAWLVSRQIGFTSPQCLNFYYNMNGKHIGSLNVYVKTGAMLPSAPVWSLSGPQGPQWALGQATVRANIPYRIVFEGVIGNGYQGDISIDDISMTNSACKLPGNCDFEGGLCTWTNPGGIDNFDWVLGRGSTASQLTGPSTDHTLGNATGQYVFIEASAPRKPGDKADLKSLKFAPTQPKCVNFWFNMHGSNLGSLSVKVVPANNTNSSTTIWQLGQDKGTAWINGQVAFSSKVPFYIIFEAVRGNGYQGDIALDDISFTNSPCLSK
ncbi:MAM and LDL-receptor class A domain-containing protein 1-like [Ruditapes philippinarum]|uniref:MAM and LDL-receptor class A domain-containing protein 1-like n=1 Tax=Ruditapes philippinarum TaxID=129788 RepID=UPI00295A7DF5|nr:MAM and LDL-receptor class A domain-containing protein 1-like [Ruditapes philippinarum]